MDQDTFLGGLFLSAILFAVLWFFFGITWWVIAAPFVLMTLALLGSTDDDPDEATDDDNILSADPPPAPVDEPTQSSITLLTTDVDMDGERALEIIQRGVAVYDHTMATLVEPGIARTSEFLTNRGANVFEGVVTGHGASEIDDNHWLKDAIKGRRLDQDLSAARLQKIFDQDRHPDLYRHFSRQLQCGFIDPEKNFAFKMFRSVGGGNIFLPEGEHLNCDFFFSSAFPEFLHVRLATVVTRITDADRYWDLWRSLVNRYGVPSDYDSLNDWLDQKSLYDYLDYFQVNHDERTRWEDKHQNLSSRLEDKEWIGPVEALTPEIIENFCGADFRRFIKKNPYTPIPWTPWI